MRRYNVAAVVMLALAVLALFALSPSNTQKIQAWFLEVVAPFLKTGSNMQRQFQAVRGGLKTLEQLERENKQLLVENKELRAVNHTLRGLEQENMKLRSSLEYRQRSVFKLIPARVIARDGSTWWNQVQIDKGSKDGIEPDMPVLTEEGLVGKTTVVADSAATVLLIADESCRAAGNVEGTRNQGIVSGERSSSQREPLIGLGFLSKTAVLQPGQKIYTSGAGGVYPSGILIGTVKEFQVRPLDGYAKLTPAVDLANLEDLFIVVGQK